MQNRNTFGGAQSQRNVELIDDGAEVLETLQQDGRPRLPRPVVGSEAKYPHPDIIPRQRRHNADAEAIESSPTSRRSGVVGVVTGLVILVAVIFAVAKNRDDFVRSWQGIGLDGLVLALGLGVINGVLNSLVWRTVLSGLGVQLRDAGISACVLSGSQSGKYLPGAVWPIVLQTQAARRHGADRRSIVAGNMVMLAVSLLTGLLIAGLLLPFSVPSALGRFWWVLATLPLLVVAAHPSTLPALMDFILRRTGRQPLGVKLRTATILRAMGWAVLAWLALGCQTTVLVGTLGGEGIRLFALCTGGVSLAVCAGVLFLPAPGRLWTP